jgi:AbrB family looped-hinge helix DNA binding protein
MMKLHDKVLVMPLPLDETAETAVEPDITVVTRRGQVSIPARLRRKLRLEPGRRLRWERAGADELRVLVLPDAEPAGAEAMRGFARRFRPRPRSTADWMAELRLGEEGGEEGGRPRGEPGGEPGAGGSGGRESGER